MKWANFSWLTLFLMLVACPQSDAVWPAENNHGPKRVKFTVSRHPALRAPNDLARLFTAGSAVLLADDDGAGSGPDDDVSFDVAFVLARPGIIFPDQSASTFPAEQQYNYTLPRYNDIPNDVVGEQLRRATFADLKHVASAHDFSGWANPENQTIIFTQKANQATTVHEWGHNCGLPHRNSSPRNIMHSNNNPDKCKINADERAAMRKCK